jgi:flagellar biosynthesis protein FlhG
LLVLVGEPTAIANAYHLAKLVWQADATYPLSIVVNFADTQKEARSVAERFGLVTQHFTGQVPPFLGWIPFSAQLRRSVQEQTPAVRTPGPVREAFADLALAIERGRPAPMTMPAHATPSE